MQENRIHLRVIKSQRTLELRRGEALLGTYPVALGSTPKGHKTASGDGRTPEGQYQVCTRNERSKYHLALGLNYPNGQDVTLALSEGRLFAADAQRILDALAGGARPPWDTTLGGEIMIHGGGNDGDWTAGCIAVEDTVMDMLWPLCPLGTPVEILP
jgi:murein L,D-transpeptidase YafK